MSFPEYAGGGYYELSDGSRVRGKQAAIRAEGAAAKPTKDTCPRCGDTRLTQISASREASECLEPTHRKVVGVKIIRAIYACTVCGKRWSVG